MVNEIRDEIKTMIEAMTTAGYNFDWTVPEQSDKNYWGDVSAFVKTPEESFLDENNAYLYNTLNVQIYVRAKIDESSTPVNAADDKLGTALEDLKKLFGSNSQLNSSAFHIRYAGYSIEREESGDRFFPEKLISSWQVTYYQKRSDPDAT